ncbi:MAG TPA: hypothetical protein VHA57_13865 [Actinomycetota bacterium]|nr:hypothetical protein [Actinomycetota bacterium]
MAQSVKSCVNHPRRETRVSCSSCGSPICTDCMRETPVGMKCPSCARMPLHARALGKPRHYAAALGAGLGSAALLGAIAAVANLGIIGIIFPLIAGFVVGRAVAWGAKGNRNGAFMAIAAATAVVGLVAGGVLAAGIPTTVVLRGDIIGLLLAGIVAAFSAAR